MSDAEMRLAFEEAIAADRYDVTNHMAYADWLEERGEDDRAKWQRDWTKGRQEGEDYLTELASRHSNTSWSTKPNAEGVYESESSRLTVSDLVAAGDDGGLWQQGASTLQSEMSDRKNRLKFWRAWSAFTGRKPGRTQQQEMVFGCSC